MTTAQTLLCEAIRQALDIPEEQFRTRVLLRMRGPSAYHCVTAAYAVAVYSLPRERYLRLLDETSALRDAALFS